MKVYQERNYQKDHPNQTVYEDMFIQLSEVGESSQTEER